jgi:hypothetical protein
LTNFDRINISNRLGIRVPELTHTPVLNLTDNPHGFNDLGLCVISNFDVMKERSTAPA